MIFLGVCVGEGDREEGFLPQTSVAGGSAIRMGGRHGPTFKKKKILAESSLAWNHLLGTGYSVDSGLVPCSVWDTIRNLHPSLLSKEHQEPAGSFKQLDVKGIFFLFLKEWMCNVYLCCMSAKAGSYRS